MINKWDLVALCRDCQSNKWRARRWKFILHYQLWESSQVDERAFARALTACTCVNILHLHAHHSAITDFVYFLGSLQLTVAVGWTTWNASVWTKMKSKSENCEDITYIKAIDKWFSFLFFLTLSNHNQVLCRLIWLPSYNQWSGLKQAKSGVYLQVGDAVHVEGLEHLLGVGVDFKNVLLVDVRHFRDVVVTTLALLFLQLDGNTCVTKRSRNGRK